jgi:aspartyl/asparaginyl beta-hydroxylase (cupin superfamily)
LFDGLCAQLQPALSRLPAAARSRWLEALSIRAGLSEPYRSECNQLCLPRLPAIPFYETEQIPTLDRLVDQIAHIQQELQRVLADGRDEFQPYIRYQPGEPVNQWQELNHSPRWSAYPLWRNGQLLASAGQHFPATVAALQEIELADIEDLCPNVMFSALAPRTRIPPHHGETNARLVVHVPLIIPPQCELRVGYERRRWELGRLLVFDDTIEHEAVNDSFEWRYVLILDVWNPALTAADRELVRATAKFMRQFNHPRSAQR